MLDNPPVVRSKAEKLAHESLLLAVTSILCGITALPAIIWSIRALAQIRKSPVSKAASYKTIFSLVFSSCMLAVVIFLVFSVFSAAHGMANDINCISHMKELALDLRLYEEDHNDQLPDPGHWCDAIQSTNLVIFHCPDAPRKQRCSYAMNIKLRGVKDLDRVPEDTVMLFESDVGWNAAGGPEIAAPHHLKTWLHVAYINGLADYVQFTNIGKLRWDPSTNSPAGSAK